MKNYNNFNDYSNYINSLIPSMDMYNIQNNSLNNQNKVNMSNSLYDPYNGFIRGNLFKNLYDPYRPEEPYDIKPTNTQEELLTSIDALSFAMVDLGLLLDVNPNNKDAIELFNNYREEKDKLVKDYESKYSPISLNSNSLNTYPWAWNNMPWPWSNQEDKYV